MKLTTKALWIPVGILVVVFSVMGAVFSWLVISNSEETQSNALTTLIQSEVSEITTGLLLITSSQAPADAMIGLDADDDTMAVDLVNQVSGMGLDAVHLTDLNGERKYSSQGDFPSELSLLLKQAPRERGIVSTAVIGESLLGYAPIIDIDESVGFLVFSIHVPSDLLLYAQKAVEMENQLSQGAGSLKASEVIAKTEHQLKTNSESFLNQILMTIAFMLIAGLALIIGVLGTTSRNIIRPIHELLSVFNKMAEGDFTHRVKVTSSDEIGQLQTAADATVTNLHNMIKNVGNVTAQLSSSSESMDKITEDTRQRVDQQRKETEQVATAMNEMASTVQGVAQHASDAANAASTADKEASDGNSVVNETMSSIGLLAQEVETAAEVIKKVEADSESIGAVLDVIKDIAEQTNLLALNAAIEAARAGEQGRGFAVVADEVRTLASRTQQSTQEIHEMIQSLQTGAQGAVQAMDSSRQRAQASVEQAGNASASLSSITQAVTTINDMNTQIASAAEEQIAVAEEINKNIVSINQAAETNAEGAHHIATATEELNGLSEKLGGLVGRFKL